MTAFLVLASEIKSTQSLCNRLLHAAGQQIDLAQPSDPKRLVHHMAHGGGPLYCPLKQGDGLDDLTGKGIRGAQKRSDGGEEVWDGRGLAEIEATFEHRDRLVEIPFPEGLKAESIICKAHTVGVLDRFGNPHRFFATGDCLCERAQL